MNAFSAFDGIAQRFVVWFEEARQFIYPCDFRRTNRRPNDFGKMRECVLPTSDSVRFGPIWYFYLTLASGLTVRKPCSANIGECFESPYSSDYISNGESLGVDERLHPLVNAERLFVSRTEMCWHFNLFEMCVLRHCSISTMQTDRTASHSNMFIIWLHAVVSIADAWNSAYHSPHTSISFAYIFSFLFSCLINCIAECIN